MGKKKNGALFFGLVIAGVAVAGYGAGPGGWFGAEEADTLDGVEVRRGPLLISEVVRGNLKAKNSISLRSEIERETTIIFLAEEGTELEANDIVCELDVTELVDRKVTQEIAVKNAEADYTKAKEQYEIQEIQNETDIAEADLALVLAEKDLQKWQDEDGGELAHEQQKLEETIVLKEEEVARATREFDFTSELFEKGFAQANELKEHELSKQRAEIELEQATREKELQYKYGYERKLAELEAARDTAKRDVKKVEKQAIARLADFEAARESSLYELTREKEKLEKLEDQISKGTIRAPEGGMLVYGRKRSRHGQGEPVEEGMEVWERQVIGTIPRSDGMVADASLHETQLKKVQMGQPCRVTVDALPGEVFSGQVGFVAVLPDSGSWMSNPNQRLYRAEVTIDGGGSDMRPGMSCSVEVLIDEIEDALYVPRQAVYLDGDRTICFVKVDGSIETRDVTVGQDNSKWVEIEEGLDEGDFVLMQPPASFEPSSKSRSGRTRPGSFGKRPAGGTESAAHAAARTEDGAAERREERAPYEGRDPGAPSGGPRTGSGGDVK